MKSKLILTSIYTITGLYGLFVAILLLVFMLAGLDLSGLLLGSIVVLVVQFLIAPYITDFVVRFLYKANFKAEMPSYLHNFIEKTCNENNMKFPKIGVINDSAPNAFTYGRTKNDARIIFSKGLIELLDEEEVKAVVAHEIGHAVHYDMALMTIAQLVPLVLYYVYISAREVADKTNNDKLGSALSSTSFIVYIGYVISQYIVLWFSRVREYYADEFSINATNNPNALSSALVKIGFGLVSKTNQNTSKKASTFSALGISDSKQQSLMVTLGSEGVNPELINASARWELFNWWAKLVEIHSTHPLISKRIKAISNHCSSYNQLPIVNFDKKAPEDFKNEFFKEIFIKLMPSLALGIAIVSFVFVSDIKIGSLLLFISGLFSFISINRKYKKGNRDERNIASLLGEYNVSEVTSIPCTIRGTLLGKGQPGYIFASDFIVQDQTGIMYLDYKQPIGIMDFFFGAFKAKNYIGKEVIARGWYRRGTIPYIQLESFEVEGTVKKLYAHFFAKLIASLIIVTSIVLPIIVSFN